jgi:hypothetical protein
MSHIDDDLFAPLFPDYLLKRGLNLLHIDVNTMAIRVVFDIKDANQCVKVTGDMDMRQNTSEEFQTFQTFVFSCGPATREHIERFLEENAS